MNKLKVAAAVLAAGAVTACGAAPSNDIKLDAAGATFPAGLYQAWFASLRQETGAQVNYQAVGSGAGVRQYTANTIDFGASDKAIIDEKIPEQGVVQIPMTGGAIAVAYNNPACPTINISQTQLADIYLGKINSWSQLPNCDDVSPITAVYRSDGSGTTAGFTASLSAFSPEWKNNIGAGKAVNWATGIGAKGNAGVAAQIKNTPGSIGYVNYGYGMNGRMQLAAIENREGFFVLPDAETSAAGLAGIVLDSKLRGSDPNPAGASSYPIVSLTWILAYPEADNSEDVKTVLRYMLEPAQQQKADSLGYVPLPETIRLQALEAVETLK